MSAEGVQHRQGQLTSKPQTVCPPPLWEALQGPPFPDQQVQEQLHPCGCHPTELCTTPIAHFLLYIYIYVFTYSTLHMHILCTFLLFCTSGWMLNCISLSRYLYSVQ